LLRVLAVGAIDDAGSVRDTLTKKADVVRRAMVSALAAIESSRVAADDEKLPEDPFGVEEKRARASAGGGSGEDVAVGAGGASSPCRTSSIDVSALARALSPKSEGPGARGADADERDGDDEGRADVFAAAAGLARMYGASGGDGETHAGFYRGVVRR
jgi:hypothetical protein